MTEFGRSGATHRSEGPSWARQTSPFAFRAWVDFSGRERQISVAPYSHSIVAGGLPEMS